ncbi:putative MFS family arabinose efflux permease [Paenibacillus sp. RC73]|uniref:MFS transporter n=1 Tax=Paenibacillus sp. RC73 TaxID=3156250 RepID=UPI003836A289
MNYYVQSGLHYSVQSTSMVFLPLGVGFFLTSLLSSRLVKRWGRAVLKSGTLTMGVSSFLLIGSLHMDAIHLFHIQNIMILGIYGLGLGMATTPLANVVLGTVSAEDAGTGSGLFTTSMYLANSLGVALIGILFSSSLRHTLSEAHCRIISGHFRFLLQRADFLPVLVLFVFYFVTKMKHNCKITLT